MRVTTQMLAAYVKSDMARISDQLLKRQRMVSSGKRIHSAADDPVGMRKVLDYRQSLAAIDQYQENIARGKIRLDFTNTILQEAASLLNQAKEIAVTESNGTFDTRPTTAAEVRQIHDRLVDLANSKLGNSHLFAGHKSDLPPFAHHIDITGGIPGNIEFGLADDATDTLIEIRNAAGTIVRTLNTGDGVTPGSGGSAGVNSVAWDGLDGMGVALADGDYTFSLTAQNAGVAVVDYETYNGDTGNIRLILGDGMDMEINTDGLETFGDTFARLALLQQGLQNPDPDTGTPQIEATVTPLINAYDQVVQRATEGAARYKRLESTENQYGNLKLNLQDMLSETEDADIAQTIVEMQNLKLSYESSLATAARMLQTTLLNFLR